MAMTTDKRLTDNLAANIRFLCHLEGTISAAALRLGINRQQLNKNLNGTSKPSLQTLNKLCRHFSVDETEIFLDTEELKDIVLSRKETVSVPKGVRAALDVLNSASAESAASLSHLEGDYFFYSIGKNPAMINRAFCSLYRQDGHLFATHIETYIDKSDQRQEKRLIHRFDSIVMGLGDRITMMTLENPTKPQISLSNAIFYPTSFTKDIILEGLAITVSNFGSRMIYYSPVVMQQIGKNANKFAARRFLGYFATDDPTIAPSIRDYLLRKHLPRE